MTFCHISAIAESIYLKLKIYVQYQKGKFVQTREMVLNNILQEFIPLFRQVKKKLQPSVCIRMRCSCFGKVTSIFSFSQNVFKSSLPQNG